MTTKDMLNVNLQSKVAELSEVGDELATSKKERSSLQTKVIQLTTALKSALAAKVSLMLWLFNSSLVKKSRVL